MSSSVVNETEFIWRIENSEFLGQVTSRENYENTERFRSPFIAVGNPCHSLWYFVIYAVTSSKGIRLRYDYFSSLEYRAVLLKHAVSLMGFNGKTTKVPRRYESENGNCILDKQTLLQKFLTLRCRFTASDPSQQYTTRVIDLKEKFKKLFLNGEFSDLTLCTKDKEFLVHKFLLEMRAPKLLEDLELLNENHNEGRVKVHNISTAVLQTLLQYIYSGELDVLPEDILPEFYEIIEEYQLSEMINFFRLKKSATITKEIKVIRRTICCKVDAKDALSDKTIFLGQINFEGVRFLVKLFSKATAQKPQIQTRIQCLSSLDEDIFMSCITSSGLSEIGLNHETKITVLFSSKNSKLEHSFSQELEDSSEDIKKGLYLELNLAISNGRYFTSVMNGMTPPHPGDLSNIGMISLYNEINFDNEGDVILCFAGGKLSAHKAVLAAWSRVFSRMFHLDMKEKKSGEVNIPDIDYYTGYRLLDFMYSADVDEEGYEADVKLYDAADKYQVSLLFAKCSSFLASHLTLDNACDTLVLADQHNDKNLLEAVQKYIATYSHDVLGSNEWLSLIETHPRVVSVTLQYISGDIRQLRCSK